MAEVSSASAGDAPAVGAVGIPEGLDLGAFERAAKLLARDEHLNDDGPKPKGGTRHGGPPPRRQPSGARQVGRGAPRKAEPPRVETPPEDAELPTLAQLSQLNILAKPNSKVNHGRRAGAAKPPPLSLVETKKATVSAMEAAMPSLDEESARLVARARALLDSNGRDFVPVFVLCAALQLVGAAMFTVWWDSERQFE